MIHISHSLYKGMSNQVSPVNFDIGIDPYKRYDASVQAVLDEYWPGTTDMKSIKRAGDKNVYSAHLSTGEKCIVKSVSYDATLEQTTEDYMFFVNYMSNYLSVASYYEPGVEASDDLSKLVTVSRFAPGVAPEKLGPDAPWSWILDEAAVRA